MLDLVRSDLDYIVGRGGTSWDVVAPWLKTAYIVHAKLDYCNSLFLAIDLTQINRLQAIQNALARAVTKPQNITTSLLFSRNFTGLKS